MSAGGPAYAVLLACAESQARLVYTRSILNEFRDVLGRPRLRARNPALTDAAVDGILDLIAQAGTGVEEPPKVYPLSRDPKDEVYLNLAIAIEADYLVSRDRDLLDLMDEETPDGRVFRQRYPALKILEPFAFLQALRELEHGGGSGTNL